VIKLEDEWKCDALSLWACHKFRSKRNKFLTDPPGLEERHSNIRASDRFGFNYLAIFIGYFKTSLETLRKRFLFKKNNFIFGFII
jgi:hypothetical protein